MSSRVDKAKQLIDGKSTYTSELSDKDIVDITSLRPRESSVGFSQNEQYILLKQISVNLRKLVAGKKVKNGAVSFSIESLNVIIRLGYHEYYRYSIKDILIYDRFNAMWTILKERTDLQSMNLLKDMEMTINKNVE